MGIILSPLPPSPPPSVPYAECDAGQQCGACLMAIPAAECPTIDANNNLVDADGGSVSINECPYSAFSYHQYTSTYYLGALCYHYPFSSYRSCGSARHVRGHLATPTLAREAAPPALALSRAASSRPLLCGRHG